MKRSLFLILALVLLAVPAAADSWFSIRDIKTLDYGSHERLIFTVNVGTEGWPPPGAAGYVVYLSRYWIGSQEPQYEIKSAWVPDAGVDYLTFWIVKPAKLSGDWHVLVQLFGAGGVKIAHTDDFTWPFTSSNFTYYVPVMSVGYGFTSALSIINPNAAATTAVFTLYPQLKPVSRMVNLAAHEVNSVWLDQYIQGPFSGYAVVEAPVPLIVAGITGQDPLNGNYLVPAVK